MSHIVQTNTKTSQECETALISQLWSIMVSVMRSVMESVMGPRLNKKSLLVFPKYYMECNMIWKILQNIHRDHYICDVKWLDTGSLAVLWMNRSLGVDQPCDRVCKNNDCNDDNDDGCNDDTDDRHNLECVHRLQNTSFYSLCPPPDYQCNQVLMIDIILIMIIILIIIQIAIIFIQVWNIQIIVTKA